MDGLSGDVDRGLGGAAAFRALYDADETQALARHRADQPLNLTAVTYSPTCRADTAGKGRFGDDPAAPNRRQEVVPADHAVAVLHQID